VCELNTATANWPVAATTWHMWLKRSAACCSSWQTGRWEEKQGGVTVDQGFKLRYHPFLAPTLGTPDLLNHPWHS
jgi:hypothetical protein